VENGKPLISVESGERRTENAMLVKGWTMEMESFGQTGKGDAEMHD